MSEKRVQQIKESVSALRDFISQMGEPLSEQNQIMLAKVLEHAATRIKELREPGIEATLPEGIGQLWYLAGGNPDSFIDYMRSVPDPSINSLLNNPVQLKNVIERLQENQPQDRNRQSDGIQQAPIQSSNIWGFSYDKNTKNLYVKFQGDGIYQYNNVPPQIFNLFREGAVPAKTDGQNNYGKWWKGKMPSLGASLFELIKKNGYPYKKVA